MGNLCNTVPISGSLAVFIRSVIDEEPLLLLFDTNVLSLLELFVLLLGFTESLGYKQNKITHYLHLL